MKAPDDRPDTVVEVISML
jgi:hypothetical protein